MTSIYRSQLKRLRFWKEFGRSYFAAVGLMAFLIGLWGLVYPDFFKGQWQIAAIVGALAFIWSLWAGRPQAPSRDYRCNTTIRLVVGDIFDQRDAHILIGMASTFDTDVYSGIIARNSLQGQFLERNYAGSIANLDDAIDRALAASGAVSIGTVNKPGKQDVYPIGTVATISVPDGKRYFCVAYTDFDVHNIAHGTVQGMLDSLNSLWDECDRVGNGRAICVPLIGQGMARIPEMSSELSLRITVLSYLLRSKRQRFSEELRIVVHPSAADRIDMQEFQAFLTSLET
ncbi:macro domain-containing protein [Nocardia flavorosea]|uniref:macro domain-containing protein n=1 Tax=Nocardia flavorosea TaxID=53429 RepID=UPI002454BAFB|nr:macro domain-containing protein [Nocardia flavorosea]